MTGDDDFRLRALWAWSEIVAHTGCWEHIPSTGELLWSDNLYRIFGLDAGTRLSVESVFAAVHPNDRERAAASMALVEETSEAQVLDVRITRTDGQRRHLRTSLALGERRPGEPDHMIGVVQDITDSLHAEREIAAHVAVEEALVDWRELDSGARGLMARLATALDCLAGIFWVPLGDLLVPRVRWHGQAVDPILGHDAPGPAPLPRGVGPAGRAWQTAEPSTITADDAAGDRPAPAGPSGAVAIPAVDGQDVLAVIELRADREIVLGERLTRSLCGISHELGHFLARRGGELAQPLLTPREVEVLQLAAGGLSARRTAHRLTVSPTTIRTHLENIYLKLGVSDKSSAVATAMRLGLID